MGSILSALSVSAGAPPVLINRIASIQALPIAGVRTTTLKGLTRYGPSCGRQIMLVDCGGKGRISDSGLILDHRRNRNKK